MAEGVNVRLSGKLQDFVKLKSDPEHGTYGSASEYIRDLIRHDYEKEEARKWAWLKEELSAGMAADESEFVELDIQGILAEAKQRRTKSNGA